MKIRSCFLGAFGCLAILLGLVFGLNALILLGQRDWGVGAGVSAIVAVIFGFYGLKWIRS